MFEYIIISGESKINTPFVKNYSSIKNEVERLPNYIRTISTYPNGAVLELQQWTDKIIIKSTVELIKNEDGTFTLPE